MVPPVVDSEVNNKFTDQIESLDLKNLFFLSIVFLQVHVHPPVSREFSPKLYSLGASVGSEETLVPQEEDANSCGVCT